MANNKSDLRPIYRSANKLRESIMTNIMASFGPETTHGKEVKAFSDEQKALRRWI